MSALVEAGAEIVDPEATGRMWAMGWYNVGITGYIGGGGFETSWEGFDSYVPKGLVRLIRRQKEHTRLSQTRFASPSMFKGSILMPGPIW